MLLRLPVAWDASHNLPCEQVSLVPAHPETPPGPLHPMRCPLFYSGSLTLRVQTSLLQAFCGSTSHGHMGSLHLSLHDYFEPLSSPKVPATHSCFVGRELGRTWCSQLHALLKWRGRDLNLAPDLTSNPQLPTGPAASVGSSWRQLRVERRGRR